MTDDRSPLCPAANTYWSIALPEMSDSADWALVKASMDGNSNAFADLIERYRPTVSRIVFRTLGNTAESEDAMQEIFIRVADPMDGRPTRDTLMVMNKEEGGNAVIGFL